MNKKNRDRKVKKIFQLKKSIDSCVFNIVILKDILKDKGIILATLDQWSSDGIEILVKDFNDSSKKLYTQFLNELIKIFEDKKRNYEGELNEILENN